MFRGASILRWVLMLLQLCIASVLTALGSMSRSNGTPITVLGAINTIAAGILAFLHNSGLPERYGYDMQEFRDVEDHIKEILDSGIAPADLTTEQILAECFQLYREASETVKANMPENYRSRKAKSVRGDDPPATTDPKVQASVISALKSAKTAGTSSSSNTK